MSIWNSKSNFIESWRSQRGNKKFKRYTHLKHATKKSNPNVYKHNQDIVRTFKELAQDKPKEDILKMLCGYTQTKLTNNFIPYYKRRHQKLGKPYRKCFVCKINQADCYHHIIMIVNGGFAQPMNTIEICNDCHALIHTWLNKAYKIQADAPLNLQREHSRSSSICPISPGEIGNN